VPASLSSWKGSAIEWRENNEFGEETKWTNVFYFELRQPVGKSVLKKNVRFSLTFFAKANATILNSEVWLPRGLKQTTCY